MATKRPLRGVVYKKHDGWWYASVAGGTGGGATRRAARASLQRELHRDEHRGEFPILFGITDARGRDRRVTFSDQIDFLAETLVDRVLAALRGATVAELAEVMAPRVVYQPPTRRRGERRWVASLPGVPGAYSQGRTKASARRNLLDAIRLLAKCRADGLVK